MPRKREKPVGEIEEKLEYIGLDLNKIPQSLKEFQPLKFKPSNQHEEGKYKQYRYVPIKDIEIIISPTNRLDDIKEKYSKASPIYSYLIPDKEQNILKHTKFLSMLKNVKIEDIENIEQEQKILNKKIPFKIKYSGNYLWQIYYSAITDKYFMLVPTEDTDYSTFFYLLKKKLEKRKTGKVFVPISHIEYSNQYLKKSQYEDIGNYIWSFTKDWPLIYDVYDKKDELSIQIIGETEVYAGIKTPYKVKLKNKIEAVKFYKLLKALFILQTEVPDYFKFETNINRYGGLEFSFEGEKIDYDYLPEFIKEEYIKIDSLHDDEEIDIEQLSNKLEDLKIASTKLESYYLSKEKQISTFLECKKTFFGKVKYFFKYNKKSKGKRMKERWEENDDIIDEFEEDIETDFIEEKKTLEKKEIKDHYTIDELIEMAGNYIAKQTKIKHLLMDINALKLKNKNLEKKIENATAYIDEIDSHRKSIFEFWKYSNKDEMSSLPEGELEELNVKKKIDKTFNYREELEDFGKEMDKLQRKKLSQEEFDSLFIITTDVLEILNKVRTNTATPKEIETALKNIKIQAKEEKGLEEKEDFDVFGGKSEDNTKIGKIANKKHRELPKDKYEILDITKNTKQLGYKLTLERISDEIDLAISKIKITENVPAYIAISGRQIDINELNMFNLNPEMEIKRSLEKEDDKINLYRVNLKRNTNAAVFTNSVFYNNKNKTLPIGMDLSTNIIFDMQNLERDVEQKKSFRILRIQDDEKITIKTVNVLEYNKI